MNEKLEKLLHRCNEMDITEQLNLLGDANMPYQAQLEYAALRARVEAAEEKVKAATALLNEWRYLAKNKPMSPIRAQGYKTCADELAAALAKRGEG